MEDCCVCLMSVRNAPFGEQNNGEPAPVVSECGHVFHKFCWTSSIQSDPRCPKCRVNARATDAYPFYPEPESEIETLRQELASMSLEKERFKSERDGLAEELEGTKKRVDELEASAANWRQLEGSRNIFEEYSDSTCYNCESKEHLTSSCEHRPILKNKEVQSGGKYDGRPYEFRCMMQGATAGELVKKYQDKFRMTFSRVEIQVVFAFLFFDSCCWKCASPFHDQMGCSSEEAAAGVKKVAKLMHLQMHPLSDEEVLKRIDKCRLHGK